MFKKFLPLFLLTSLLFSFSLQVIAQTTPDPGLMGTHTVIKKEYNLGDAYYAAIPPYLNHSMECRGSVHYPSDLTSGPFPVLFWLHGRHETCYNPSTLATYSSWPCNPGDSAILSYEGYDYAAKTMASHGYIVISLSANAINAYDGVSGFSSDDGMTARGQLVQDHMDLWNGWNTTVTTGPFDSLFRGRLNMQNIGTMGHSRGGEGVIYNAEYNRTLGSPYGIKAILTLAPVDFYRHVVNGIALLDIAPYCDGDVNDLQGVHFYDDARYRDTTDLTPKHTLLVMGANHNYFNTVWTPLSYPAGGIDDWTYTGTELSTYCGTNAVGSGRLDSASQKAVYNTYAAAFYRLYIGKELQFAPILTVNDIKPPASAIVDSSKLFVSYHAGHEDRLDVNTEDTLYDYTVNTLGGNVTLSSSFTAPDICGGGLAQPACDAGVGGAQKPHGGTAGTKGIGQMKLTWTDTTATYDNVVPAAYQNFTKYLGLTFRSCENFKETTSGPALNFSVQLVDSSGSISNQVVGNYTHALFFQPGTTGGDLPKEVFNTIRVPISGFTGVNLAKIRHIKFHFNQGAAGAVLVSDLALTNPVCGNFSAAFTDSLTHVGHKVLFTNKSFSVVNTDTLKYFWNFGDPATGLTDTSTLQNPSHIFSKVASYTVCLTVTSHRKNGFTCTDSICTVIAVPHGTGIPGLDMPEITIIPNPAKDYLQINGAEKTDVLKLFNIYGQEVFTASITQPIINLPQTLPAGMYFAIVVTPNGNYYQKVLISR